MSIKKIGLVGSGAYSMHIARLLATQVLAESTRKQLESGTHTYGIGPGDEADAMEYGEIVNTEIPMFANLQQNADGQLEHINRGITINESMEQDRMIPYVNNRWNTIPDPTYQDNIKVTGPVHHNQKSHLQPKKKSNKRRISKQSKKKNR